MGFSIVLLHRSYYANFGPQNKRASTFISGLPLFRQIGDVSLLMAAVLTLSGSLVGMKSIRYLGDLISHPDMRVIQIGTNVPIQKVLKRG